MTGSESERRNEKGGVKRIQRWMGNRKEESEADMGGKRVGEGIAVLLPRLPFQEGTTKQLHKEGTIPPWPSHQRFLFSRSPFSPGLLIIFN